MSFVRKQQVSGTQDPGTRPGLHGRVLVSSGCNELDRLLGAGLPLGTLTLIQEDGVSNNHLALLKYFVGEGVACAQASAKQDDVQLRIAWQYQRYAQQDTALRSSGRESHGGVGPPSGSTPPATPPRPLGSSTPMIKAWAHSFDIARSSGNIPVGLVVHGCSETGGDGDDGTQGALRKGPLVEVASDWLKEISNTGLPPGVPSRNPKHVGRLAVLTLTTPTPHDTITTLHTLKHLARTHRCAVLVTVPTGVYGGDCDVLLHHVADVVLQLQPLMDDHPLLQLIADPQTCCGLMHVAKYPLVNAMASPPVPGPLQVLRHKPRKLIMEEAKVDPDKEFGGGDAQVSSSASVAAAVCGGPKPGKKQNVLDF